jgi:hypothetical protein
LTAAIVRCPVMVGKNDSSSLKVVNCGSRDISRCRKVVPERGVATMKIGLPSGCVRCAG